MLNAAIFTALASLAAASPILQFSKWKRNDLAGLDFEIINLARNLESLELAYWNQGLDNYTDADFSAAGLDGYRDYVRQFRDHEIVHFTVLNDAAGGGFENCTYNTFDVYDIPSFLAQGQVVTSVGEGAFIGALGKLSSPMLRQSGGSILGNEARQNSKLREALNLGFFNAFPLDTPLTASQAYSLAKPLLSGCPSSNPPINFFLSPPLMASFASDDHSAGSTVNVMWDSSKVYLGSDVFITFLNKDNSIPADLTQTGDGQGTVQLPDGLDGTAFLSATNYQGAAPIPDEQNFAIGFLVVN